MDRTPDVMIREIQEALIKLRKIERMSWICNEAGISHYLYKKIYEWDGREKFQNVVLGSMMKFIQREDIKAKLASIPGNYGGIDENQGPTEKDFENFSFRRSEPPNKAKSSTKQEEEPDKQEPIKMKHLYLFRLLKLLSEDMPHNIKITIKIN